MARRRKRPDYLKLEEWEHDLTGAELWELEIKQQEREEYRRARDLASKRIKKWMDDMQRGARVGVDGPPPPPRAVEPSPPPDFSWLTRHNEWRAAELKRARAEWRARQ